MTELTRKRKKKKKRRVFGDDHDTSPFQYTKNRLEGLEQKQMFGTDAEDGITGNMGNLSPRNSSEFGGVK